MTSKQEKLAAARRKLKEFQVKNKEAENSKQKKPNDIVTSRSSKDYSCSSGDSRNSPLLSQNISPVNIPTSIPTSLFKEAYSVSEGGGRQDGKENQRKISTESNKWSEHCSSSSREKLDDSQNLGNSHEYGLNQIKAFSESPVLGNGSKQNHVNSISCNDVKSLDPKEFFNVGSTGGFDEVIKPLQVELENHAQTINILVQQRNEVQNALTQAHALLNKKSGEIEELNRQIGYLNMSVTNLNERLKEADEFSQTLHSKSEEYLQKWKEAVSRVDELQVKLESKEEELLELRKKYEEKSSESQRLLFNLQETQSQLSLTQIQAQQFSTEGQTALAVQVSDLQKENLNMKQKTAELERCLESERAEKEESSQKFHIYAQQCNVQLTNLNVQLKALQSENEKLNEENAKLLKNLSELGEEKEKNSSLQSYETEIADLHDQLSALKEKTSRMEMDLSRKKQESIYLKEELETKDAELNQLETIVNDLEEKNKRLLLEAETPKANERLLATMESDKVAAKKAVSQNVKLKEQIVELEEAFMKLSQEKLQLTDELAHEKHIRSELQKRVESESNGSHDHECHHEKDEHEPLVNDSNEIEELRNIVRQLQDDKMELTARLNAYEAKKTNDTRESSCEHNHNHDHTHEHQHEHDDTDCENAKVRLQQMEEKVRRTMNEIAILDEEKEKLEHLVLQLQGETETIGEYITLYQRQRMMLKQKAQEKDIRLMQLSQDKEELKSKLAALDDLVQRLIAERESIRTQPGSKTLSTPLGVSENTVGKIRALISEIGSTNLISNQSGVFEHCPCCSGRLITI